MPPRIAEKIRAKVTRAEEHVVDFQLCRDAFIESNPYEIAVEKFPTGGNARHVVSRIESPPDALAVIAADVVQNLRGALDNLAFQLVLDARGGTKPNWPVYFPITKSAADYVPRRDGTLKGVRQEVVDEIDAMEPYKSGKGHRVWQLQSLSNPDKHELLLDASFYFRSIDIASEMEADFRQMPGFEHVKMPPLRLRPADTLTPLKVGDVVYEGPADPDMVKNGRLLFDVSIHAPGVIEPGESALQTLKAIAEIVSEMIWKLRPLLP
jgi:hypothetical protein